MRTRAGIGLALAAAVISGFSVYINSYGVHAWGKATGGAAAYTTAKNLVAAIVLIAVLALVARRAPARGRTRTRTRPRRPKDWAALFTIAVIGGSVPFVLFFEGLARVSSSNAAFIQKTLVVRVALLAVPLLRERLSLWHVAAIAGLVWGQALLGGVHGIGLGIRPGAGEAMIFAATLLWAAETIVARNLLREMSALTVASARMGGGVAILIGYTLATTKWSELTATGWHQWSWAIATGLILAAYVGTWYAALARAGAIDVTALLVPGAIITALLASGSKALAPQGPGLALIAAGTVLVLVAAARKNRKTSTGPALAGVR
jgi:drug/metabolite transporter (DMT)-like permease